jgi:hypothetical protein
MTVILIIIAIFIAIIILGNLKGPPKPGRMTNENLLWRINSEEKWIDKYLNLPYDLRQEEKLKKQYEEKKIYRMELILELQKEG